MFFRTILILSLALATPHLGLGNSSYGEVYKEVDEFLELSDKYDKAKEDSFLASIVSDTKGEVNMDMNDFLDDVLSILANENMVKIKKNIADLTEDNRDNVEEIAELTIRRQGAETEKKFYEVWKKSQNDIDKKIEKLRQEIIENKYEIEGNKREIISFLRANGVNLSEAEADSLLKTVTINDFVDTVAVLKSVHAIIGNLQQSLESQDENILIARKYYGLFWLSTKAYARQLEIFTDKIEKTYLPNLAQLEVENNTLIQETKALASKNSNYKSNLDAQILTGEAIDIYRKVLNSQKDGVEKQKAQVNQALKHAENTYKTVKLAHSLYQSMDASISSYKAIMSLPIIEMAPFKNTSLELKMLELTEQISQ